MLSKTEAMYEILLGCKAVADEEERFFKPNLTLEDLNILDETLDKAIELGYAELVESHKEFAFEPTITKKGLEYLELLEEKYG